jgi:hypothetical protein
MAESAKEWIRRALAEPGLPGRKKILDQARKLYPESPEIDWELLFIGHPDPDPPRGRIDYSIIKSFLLDIYRHPETYTEEKRDRMRTELFRDPLLTKILEETEQPEEKLRAYLLRLCREYIDIFLAEDRRLTGGILGLLPGRSREKAIAGEVSGMIRRTAEDPKLSPEERELLREALTRAFSERDAGRNAYLPL